MSEFVCIMHLFRERMEIGMCFDRIGKRMGVSQIERVDIKMKQCRKSSFTSITSIGLFDNVAVYLPVGLFHLIYLLVC